MILAICGDLFFLRDCARNRHHGEDFLAENNQFVQVTQLGEAATLIYERIACDGQVFLFWVNGVCKKHRPEIGSRFFFFFARLAQG